MKKNKSHLRNGLVRIMLFFRKPTVRCGVPNFSCLFGGYLRCLGGTCGAELGSLLLCEFSNVCLDVLPTSAGNMMQRNILISFGLNWTGSVATPFPPVPDRSALGPGQRQSSVGRWGLWCWSPDSGVFFPDPSDEAVIDTHQSVPTVGLKSDLAVA